MGWGNVHDELRDTDASMLFELLPETRVRIDDSWQPLGWIEPGHLDNVFPYKALVEDV